MSSPIRQAKDLDATVISTRRQARGQPLQPKGPLPKLRRARLPNGDAAMMELQRQLSLNPNIVPEPPFVSDGMAWWTMLRPIALRLSAVVGIAALVAWGIVYLSHIGRI